MKKESSKFVLYENIELIGPEQRQELIADLEKRTGIKINRLSIERIDFLRDSATIRIFYFDTN